ncbi:MAG: ANTAR domain-containing protein [Eubacterium sp.]|nr:ANTAR domain-containing protein [Eubacterium sp.]
MSLKEKTYSVLVVSVSKNFITDMHTLLSSSKYEAVKYTGSVSSAKRANLEKAYDIVIIDTPLPDDTGDELAVDLSTNENSIVMMLVHYDLYEEVHENYSKYGIFVASKPTSVEILSQSLNWLKSARERTRSYEKRTLSIEDKMQEIRLVNLAKLKLITDKGMSEDEAHKYISKQAMDKCVNKGAIAQEILNK